MRRAEEMKDKIHSIVPWSAPEVAPIPTKATPEEIVSFAQPQLSSRDMTSIIRAFDNESYEMVSTFVWTKAASVLKKQISALGMDFVGEMLGRPDLDEDSDPATSLADYEAISLAEDLGIVNSTQGIRLKHALELVTHFNKLEQPAAEEEVMAREEAVMLLKICITSILSRPNFEAAVKFADFRKSLTERTIKAGDGDVLAIAQSPYFFIRTTMSVLLSLVKTTRGAAQEHAIGNAVVLLPSLWPKLRQPEKWQVGQAYAEVSAEGNRGASSGLKKALLAVHGFDFVPENLRSNTFSEAAARVLAAHFSFNNYYNEQEPISVLANLGSAIPKPAFPKCMEATLAVWLGNEWGHSWGAESAAKRILESLRTEQWEYYLNECLRRDRTILDKLAYENKSISRWTLLTRHHELHNLAIRDKTIRALIKASFLGKQDQVQQRAQQVRAEILE